MSIKGRSRGIGASPYHSTLLKSIRAVSEVHSCITQVSLPVPDFLALRIGDPGSQLKLRFRRIKMDSLIVAPLPLDIPAKVSPETLALHLSCG